MAIPIIMGVHLGEGERKKFSEVKAGVGNMPIFALLARVQHLESRMNDLRAKDWIPIGDGGLWHLLSSGWYMAQIPQLPDCAT